MASDPDVGDVLTYTIVDHSTPIDPGTGLPSDPRQNPFGIFVLNPATGQLSVKSSLTPEQINAFSITI